MQSTSPKKASTAVDFYRLAAEAGVPVVPAALPQVRSLSLPDGDTGIIGIDTSHPMTFCEEQAHLGHELGHCLYGGFYTRATPYDAVERHEIRADHWYIRHAIPRAVLFGLLRQGFDAWEIAERLSTTEDYIRMAYYYYKENPARR